MLTLEQYQYMEEAWNYQDFVTRQLLKIGISVNAYQGYKYQMQYGESASGIEIKNDRLMASTKNVYIEFKQVTMRGTEKNSGIQQADQSWLYVIGDYSTIYIFAKNQLKNFLSKVQSDPVKWSRLGIKMKVHKDVNGKITSNGLAIPIEYIEKTGLAINKIEVKNEER